MKNDNIYQPEKTEEVEVSYFYINGQRFEIEKRKLEPKVRKLPEGMIIKTTVVFLGLDPSILEMEVDNV